MRRLPIHFAAMALVLIVSGPVCGGDTVDVASDRQAAQETANTSGQGVVHATLNGLGITIDARTGGIVGLSYDGPGQILDSPASEAAAIDLAYPIKVFEPLRLASRFSTDARINVAPFISIVQADYGQCEKYGLVPPESGGWAQHTDTIPRFQAPYTTRYRSAGIPMTNELWQREALAECLKLVEQGITSIGWDQVWSTEGGQFQRIAHQIVDAIKKADPTATFSGEELWNMEDDATFLDCTWNWGGYRDCQAFTNSFPAPRINCTIDHAPLEVKRAFVDGLYMNIMPTHPGSVNGSARIADYPELSAALKQCAALREQFLPYFVDGRLIGHCILKEVMSPAIHASAWVLPDRILVLMLNKGGDAPYPFTFDIGMWLKPGDKGYSIQAYDSSGLKTEASTTADSIWASRTSLLKNLDIAVFEITRH